jgi:hypothetical protein
MSRLDSEQLDLQYNINRGILDRVQDWSGANKRKQMAALSSKHFKLERLLQEVNGFLKKYDSAINKAEKEAEEQRRALLTEEEREQEDQEASRKALALEAEWRAFARGGSRQRRRSRRRKSRRRTRR